VTATVRWGWIRPTSALVHHSGFAGSEARRERQAAGDDRPCREYALGHAAGAVFWKGLGHLEGVEARPLVPLRRAVAAGSLANPYGLALDHHLVEFTLHPELHAGVLEWKPLDLTRAGNGQILAATALAGWAPCSQCALQTTYRSSGSGGRHPVCSSAAATGCRSRTRACVKPTS